MGAKLCAVTLGEGGAILSDGKHALRGEGYRVDAADTTGAGDSFWGSLCAVLIGEGMDPGKLSREDMELLMENALAASAICVTARGAIPAMPCRDEVQEFLYKNRPVITDL